METETKSRPTADTTSFPFLQLPAELRILVYRRLYTRHEPIPLDTFYFQYPISPDWHFDFDMTLLRSNKQVQSEAEDVFYSNNFEYDLSVCHIAQQQVPATSVLQKLRKLTIRLVVTYRLGNNPHATSPQDRIRINWPNWEWGVCATGEFGGITHSLQSLTIHFVGRLVPTTSIAYTLQGKDPVDCVRRMLQWCYGFGPIELVEVSWEDTAAYLSDLLQMPVIEYLFEQMKSCNQKRQVLGI